MYPRPHALREALDPDAERRGALLADLEEYAHAHAHAPANARPRLSVLEAIAAMDSDDDAGDQAGVLTPRDGGYNETGVR